MKFTLEALSTKIGGELRGPADLTVEGILPIENAQPGYLCHVEDVKKLAEAEASLATALLIPAATRSCARPAIAVQNPKLALATLLRLFHPEAEWKGEIHPHAFVHPEAKIGAGTSVGANAVIEKGAAVGERVLISPLAYVAEGVVVGDGCRVHSGARLLKNVRLGKECVVHEGAIIGSEGFGYATDEKGKPVHVPQIGTVILEDEVEIGANSTIDRATFGETRIGRGAKIDNLVHVAHNCRIGENCLIAAMVGIAGSCTVEKGTIMGGQAGVKDHVTIGEGSIVAAGAKVWGDLEPGSFVSGTPARPHKENLKILAALSRLPENLKSLKDKKQANS